MTPQELFVQGAEATANTIGERHGLTMLVGGVEHMLRESGYDFTNSEIADYLHNHHVGHFWNQAAKPETVDLRQLAQAYDLMWAVRHEPSYEVRHTLEGRDVSWGLTRTTSLTWIENEVTKTLREQKIRRGTKAYQRFVELNRERVAAAVKNESAATAKQNQAELDRKLLELNKKRDAFVAGRARLQRQLDFRKALLTVTGTEPDPRAEEGSGIVAGYLFAAEERINQDINSLQNRFASAAEQAEADALERAKQSPVLGPFFVEPRACACEA